MSMHVATGAMGCLLPKLAELLLEEECTLKKSVKEGIESLEKEMKSMHAALCNVAEVLPDQLDEQVKLWAGEVTELSFDMEDVIDKFIAHVDDSSETATNSSKLEQLTKKFEGLFAKGKVRPKISDVIKDINKQVNELVGIAGKRDQDLMRLLSDTDMPNKELKIVSVVGFGGLGKTTLVKTVYDNIKGDFDCNAFVHVGQNAEVKKVFKDILLGIGISQITMLDESQLIYKLRGTLQNKRYLIVIDDIWDEQLWTLIKLAFPNSNNLGSRIITTTRIISVSISCCSSANDSVYQMKPLNQDDSKTLFLQRIFYHESGCPPEFEQVSKDILRKCGGVPLVIITIASLLASGQQVKPEDEWHVLLESIGRGLTEDNSLGEMMRILLFSYYDMPSHLKTCLLYLSMFLYDQKIGKDRLIWMWIAEGFVQCETAKTSLFEIGESYFNELVNRSLILPVYDYRGIVCACHVHDSVLDLICSLASKENFVTILNGPGDGMSSQSNVRRLSLQSARKEEQHQTMHIFVEELRQEDMGLLARLPALCVLELWTLHQRLLVVAADGFCCLTYLTLFSDSPGQVVFQPGALPRAEQVALRIGLRVAKEEAARNSGDWFDLGMGSLPSLRNVDVEFDYLGMTVREAKQAEAALENALRAHSNCPTFRILPEIPEGAHDDDVYTEDDGSE